MGKRILFISTMLLYFSFSQQSTAQVAPYALSPRWVFGNKAYFNFTGAGAPAQPARTDNIIANEGASTLCLRNKTLLTYDNNVRVAGNNMVPLANPNIIGSSSSSTQGGIIIPDPSNPATEFFYITGNGESTYPTESLDQLKQGIKVFGGAQSGGSVTNPALAATLRTDAQLPSEDVSVTTDGAYGYQIVAGLGGGGSGDVVINSWRVNAAGAIGGIVTSTFAAPNYNLQYQSSIKVNRCQNKIAIVTGYRICVFNWDRVAGTIGSVIKNIDAAPTMGYTDKLYGCEFSANGNYLFVSKLSGGPLFVVDLNAAGAGNGLSTMTGTATGSLQIGPNDIIYVANGGDATDNSAVGTITNANSGPGATYNPSGLALANGSTVRLGLSNIAWLNPQRPSITPVNNSCGDYTFTPGFLTHFNDAVGYNNAVWSFGDGTGNFTNTGAAADDPINHVYTTGSAGNKTITLTLTDNTCGHTWQNTYTLNVPCILPVELISFTATAKEGGVSLDWKTATEVNNDYFDVQRSVDGINFVTIGRREGSGNSSVIRSYAYFDDEVTSGLVYYRLVQHDFDGASENSKTVVVQLGKGSGIPVSVAPNPFAESFVLTKLHEEKATIFVYDILGRVLEEKTTSAAESVVSLGTSLAKGSYLVEYVTAESSYTLRVEKQ